MNDNANDRFNTELQMLIEGKLPKNHVFHLGLPGEILQQTGFPPQGIELAASRLLEKAGDKDHPFSPEDIMNLVKSINEPVAVFSYGNRVKAQAKAQNVIVEIQKNGKNFLAGIHFNQDRRGTTISDVRGLFPKDNHEWLNWINQGKLLYADIEKIQEVVSQQRINAAEVTYLNLEPINRLLQQNKNVKHFFSENTDSYESKNTNNKETKMAELKNWETEKQGLEEWETEKLGQGLDVYHIGDKSVAFSVFSEKNNFKGNVFNIGMLTPDDRNQSLDSSMYLARTIGAFEFKSQKEAEGFIANAVRHYQNFGPAEDLDFKTFCFLSTKTEEIKLGDRKCDIMAMPYESFDYEKGVETYSANAVIYDKENNERLFVSGSFSDSLTSLKEQVSGFFKGRQNVGLKDVETYLNSDSFDKESEALNSTSITQGVPAALQIKISPNPAPNRVNIASYEAENTNSKETKMANEEARGGAEHTPEEKAFLAAVHQRKVVADGLKAGTLSCLPGADGMADTEPAVNIANGTRYHGANLLFLKEHQKQNGFPTAEYVTQDAVKKSGIPIREGQHGVDIRISEKNEAGEWENKTAKLFNVAQTAKPWEMKQWAAEKISGEAREKQEFLKKQFGESFVPQERKAPAKGPDVICSSTDPAVYLGQYLAAVSMGSKFKAAPEQAAEFSKNFEAALFAKNANGHSNPFELSKICGAANNVCKDTIKQAHAQERAAPQQEQTQSRGRGM